MLLEVVRYLMLHGSDAQNIRCKKTGKSAYDFAVENKDKSIARKNKLIAAGKYKPEKEGIPDIHEKVLECLKTKQQFFHPTLKNYNVNKRGNSSLSQSGQGRSYRQPKNSTHSNGKSSNSLQGGGPFMIDNSSKDMLGCCGCTSMFQSICKQ